MGVLILAATALVLLAFAVAMALNFWDWYLDIKRTDAERFATHSANKG